MMANIGEVTVKVNYEMTEVSKQLIRGMVAQVLKEALLDDSERVPFDSKDAVREFIREEVRNMLSESFPQRKTHVHTEIDGKEIAHSIGGHLVSHIRQSTGTRL